MVSDGLMFDVYQRDEGALARAPDRHAAVASSYSASGCRLSTGMLVGAIVGGARRTRRRKRRRRGSKTQL